MIVNFVSWLVLAVLGMIAWGVVITAVIWLVIEFWWMVIIVAFFVAIKLVEKI